MLHKILFYLFRLVVFFLGNLPFFILYRLSNFMAFVLHNIVGYRKCVVISNLQKCFPESSYNDIKKITKNFYRHISDITLETFKGFYMSREQIARHWRVVNPEVLDKYYTSGQDVINLASHYGNWEWGIVALNMQIKHQAVSIYMPMTDILAEKWSRRKRERFGMKMVSIKETRDFFSSQQKTPVSIILASDQNPTNVNKAIMAKFFGYDTPCLHGAEEYSREHNIPIVYFDVQKIKRGYYTLTITEMFDSPATTRYGQITQAYMNKVEDIIKRNPEFYLWSHRRWKHSSETVAYMLERHNKRLANEQR